MLFVLSPGVIVALVVFDLIEVMAKRFSRSHSFFLDEATDVVWSSLLRIPLDNSGFCFRISRVTEIE